MSNRITKAETTTESHAFIKPVLAAVYPFVKSWAERRHCDFAQITDTGDCIWSNDYTEYHLKSGAFDEAVLVAINIEMVRELVFVVPVPYTEGAFEMLMQLVGHK